MVVDEGWGKSLGFGDFVDFSSSCGPSHKNSSEDLPAVIAFINSPFEVMIFESMTGVG